MKHYPIDCQTCCFRTVFCKGLTPQEFDSIFRITKQNTYPKGDVIFKQGEKTDNLVF